MNQSPNPRNVSGRSSIHNTESPLKTVEDDSCPELSEDEVLTEDDETEANACPTYIIPECGKMTIRTVTHDDMLQDDTHKKQCSTNYNNTTSVILTVVVIFVCTLLSKCFLSTSKVPITISYIQQKFPLQPRETLENIETIIDDVLKIEPIHPAVFLFLYEKEKNDYDDFIQAIAEFASDKLDVKDEHIVLDENDYHSPEAQNDYGYLIAKYKPDLNEKKVMVIRHLHKMPGMTAQALHSFCDEITPLVDRAVYILTLKIDSFDGNNERTAEKYLTKYWKDLENDKLAPLIARVTSTVIKII